MEMKFSASFRPAGLYCMSEYEYSTVGQAANWNFEILKY